LLRLCAENANDLVEPFSAFLQVAPASRGWDASGFEVWRLRRAEQQRAAEQDEAVYVVVAPDRIVGMHSFSCLQDGWPTYSRVFYLKGTPTGLPAICLEAIAMSLALEYPLLLSGHVQSKKGALHLSNCRFFRTQADPHLKFLVPREVERLIRFVVAKTLQSPGGLAVATLPFTEISKLGGDRDSIKNNWSLLRPLQGTGHVDATWYYRIISSVPHETVEWRLEQDELIVIPST
jgi:hypothetical protein